MLRVQLRQVGKRLGPLSVSRPLVVKEMLGLDASMSPNQIMLDLPPIQERNEMGARNIQNISRLLRRKHLAYGDKRNGIASAHVAQ